MKILYTETSASSVEPCGFGRFMDGNGLVGSGHRSPSTSSGRPAMTLLLGGGEPDFTRQENWIRGNTRTLRRQYAARNWVFVRVLPGIAGYCRVVGPSEFGVRSAKCGMGRVGPLTVRLGPPGAAWERLIFFPRAKRGKTDQRRAAPPFRVLTGGTEGLRVAAYRSCGEPTGGSGVGIAKAESVAQERGRPVEPAPDNAGEGTACAGPIKNRAWRPFLQSGHFSFAICPGQSMKSCC
jgi:hypothetical protein